jgi:hypothetical protein
VVGASDIAQVVQLEDKYVPSDLQNMSVGQVLLSDMFSLKSLFGPQWDKAITRRNELLTKTSLSTSEQNELQSLNHEVAGLSAFDNSYIIRSSQLVNKIAQQLGIEL